MDPNNTNPSNTPPTEDTTPVQPLTTDTQETPVEAPATSEEAPISPVTPVTPETPEAPAATEAPVTPAPFGTPVETPAATPFGAAPVAPLADATTPAQPEVPAQPEATTPGAAAAPVAVSAFGAAAGTPQPPKKSNKKLITILSIVAGVLLLAIGGYLVYATLTSVSKQDYQAAASQYSKVSSVSSSLTSDVSSLSYSTSGSSDETFDEAVKDVEASIAELKTENEALGKLKAVKVGEGAKKYNEFNEKLETYLTYGQGLLTSVSNLRPALVICRAATTASDTTARVAAIEKCATALEGVKDVPNAEMKTYVAALTDGYKEYATLYKQVAALSNPFGAQYEEYKALRDKVNAVQEKISDASDTFSDAMEAKGDEVSVKEKADALRAYLIEQQK